MQNCNNRLAHLWVSYSTIHCVKKSSVTFACVTYDRVV